MKLESSKASGTSTISGPLTGALPFSPTSLKPRLESLQHTSNPRRWPTHQRGARARQHLAERTRQIESRVPTAEVPDAPGRGEFLEDSHTTLSTTNVIIIIF
eukprot:767086-Hanusia_phi.AAC.3